MTRQEFGDWQTPIELATAVLTRVGSMIPSPAVVVEPTCGEGAFLRAAALQFSAAKLVGYEINASYVATALAAVPTASVHAVDFFTVSWEHALASLPEPVLITGNPPWVTNAILGTLGSENLPQKSNFKGLSGFEALTGKSNFDVSEWMILRLLSALRGRQATLAVLCKAAVARRVIEFTAAKRWGVSPGGIWRIDAMRHFQAAVDAVLFVCKTSPAPSEGWPVYESLDAQHPLSTMQVIDGTLVADAGRVARTSHLLGNSNPEWRSGLKHDCSRVMELEVRDDGWRNGFGELVQIEDGVVFPLLKSSDVSKGITARARAVIVPQRVIGEDTSTLRHWAPLAWAYLDRHRELLNARKSSIYRGQPDFAIFGVGSYSFAPWKVAISGLYKNCQFTLIGPHRERPVMVDDTCYFLPFEDESRAREAWEALRSPLASDFLAGRIFWDSKRPVSKAVLQKLDLEALLVWTHGKGRTSPTQARLML